MNTIPPLEMNIQLAIQTLKNLYIQLAQYPDTQEQILLLITNLESI